MVSDISELKKQNSFPKILSDKINDFKYQPCNLNSPLIRRISLGFGLLYKEKFKYFSPVKNVGLFLKIIKRSGS